MPLGSASSFNIALPLRCSSFPPRQRHPPPPRLGPRGRSRPAPEPCSSRNGRAARWPRLRRRRRRRRGRGRRAAPVCPAASAAARGPGLRAPEGSLERFGLVLGTGPARGASLLHRTPPTPAALAQRLLRSPRPRGRGPGAPTPPSRPAPAGGRRSGLSEPRGSRGGRHHAWPDVGPHSQPVSGLPEPLFFPHPVALRTSASRPLRPCLPRSSPGEGQPQPAPTSCPQSLPPLPMAGSPTRLSLASSRAEGAQSGGTKVRAASAGGGLGVPGAAAGEPGGQTRRWPHLFLQRLLGRERRLGGGRAVADAALQQVEPGGPRARVALEVEEQVLQQREPLGLPFCVVRTPLAQVAFARAVLARQQSQGRDVAIVQPDPLLHGARRPARPHALTSSPRGTRQPPSVRAARCLSGARSLARSWSLSPPPRYLHSGIWRGAGASGSEMYHSPPEPLLRSSAPRGSGDAGRPSPGAGQTERLASCARARGRRSHVTPIPRRAGFSSAARDTHAARRRAEPRAGCTLAPPPPPRTHTRAHTSPAPLPRCPLFPFGC